MHIRLADSISGIDFNNASNIDALENIFASAVSGVHLVTGSRSVLTDIYSNATNINERSKGYLRKQLSKYSELGNLYKTIQPKLFIEGNIEGGFKGHPDGTYHVSLLEFLNIHLILNSTLISENLSDCELYMLAANHYSLKAKLNSFKLPRKPDLIGGGGNTTGNQLKSKIDSKSGLCLCVVDSDKYSPNDNYGDTAKKCVETYDSDLHWWVDLHIIQVREIENKIPTKLLYEALPDPALQEKFNNIQERFTNLNNLAWSFLDLKNGTTYKWLLSLEADEIKSFWASLEEGFSNPQTLSDCKQRAICSHSVGGDCQCKVVDGLGPSVAAHFIRWTNTQSIQNVVKNICETKDEKWLAVGKKVFEFFVGQPAVIRS